MHSPSRNCANALSLLLVAAAALVCVTASAADDGQSLWQDMPMRPLSVLAPQTRHARTLSLQVDAMQARLASIGSTGTLRLSLPRPDGGFATFEVADSGTMPSALQRRYPGIVSLAGRDAAGVRVRVDSSSRGFQAMVFDPRGIWIVRPETFGLGPDYASFFKSDLPAPARMQDGPDVVAGARPLSYHPASVALTNTGETQRVYRIAVAADGEYVAAVGGGTVAGGLAAVVQAINRVNQVYETELGVHLTLIANDDQIIYTDATNDPYANTSADIDTNQTNLDAVIGSANYDVGHVFTTGSGGIAGLGVTCTNSQKARGTTGLPNPTGDAFYIDFVAHELGHQFGANHPFNSETGSCGGGTRNPATAYEPGSGSTIMSYAGICGLNNLQLHSDPYFHAISLNETDTWIEAGGGSCATATASADAAPVIASNSLPPAGLTIPKHTPFILSAAATDAEGDALTYTWEQFDLGDSTDLHAGDIGNGPIFRSRPPTSSASQTFPAMASVLSGTLDPGDAWPVTDRTLNFRLTVRDNHGVPGTPQYGRTTSADAPTLTVTTAAGPFLVTQPSTNVFWPPNSTQTVTWDVAGTNQAPVNCATVTLILSTDGGASFPTVLATGTANNGSASVTIPPATSPKARIRINCDNNVFFAVSPTNFTIDTLPDGIFRNGFDLTSTLLDPGFEATTASFGSNPDWQGTDTHSNGTPFATAGDGAVVRTGTYAAWFGGYAATGSVNAYTQSVSQSVTLGSNTNAYFTYWRSYPALSQSTGNILSVLVDGNTVATDDATQIPVNATYQPVSVNISAYADGRSHTIELLFNHSNNAQDTNIFVDDTAISLTPLTP